MRKLILFIFVVLLPAVVVGISNFHVFPDSAWAATLMLVVTVGVAAVFTWQSGNATAKIRQYCIGADFVIALILCLNLGAHWLLAREVSAAKQGVVERHTEEDRELEREAKKTELDIARKKADADLQNAERRRLAQLPVSQRRSSITPKPEPTKAAQVVAAVNTPVIRLTAEQVRDSWWWKLTALAFAECFASVLAGAILAGIWEWDRNGDGIADHLQQPRGYPLPQYPVISQPRPPSYQESGAGSSGNFPSELPIDERATGPLAQEFDAGKGRRR